MRNAVLFTTFLFSINILSAQINQWAWMKGDGVAANPQYGKYGTKGVASTNNNPGPRVFGTTWKDHLGNLWLFGGLGYANSNYGDLNDLWKYNSFTNQWTWVSGDSTAEKSGVYGNLGVPSPTNKPGCRISSVAWCDQSGNFWLFGGGKDTTMGSLLRYFNDLWKYDPVANIWTWINGNNTYNATAVPGTMGVASSTNKPGGRTYACNWIDDADNLYMYGGTGMATSAASSTSLSDMWKYSIASNQWTWLNGVASQFASVYGIRGVSSNTNKPGSKIRSNSCKDLSGNFWMFAGLGADSQGNSGSKNDLWKYSVTTNEWTWVSGDTLVASFADYGIKAVPSPTNKPGARFSGVMWNDNDDNLYAFGGYGYNSWTSGWSNDFFRYNVSTDQWTWLNGDSAREPRGTFGTPGVFAPENEPGYKQYASGWTDDLGNLWLFGGYGSDASLTGTGYMSDLWKYRLSNVLPVGLVSFDGSRKDYTKLSWKVENELNLNRYEIERSFSGRNFVNIGQVTASNMQRYSFADHSYFSSESRVYYRLKIIDNDGEAAYSKVIHFDLNTDGIISVSPNPATSFLKVKLNNNITGKTIIQITNAAGKMVRQENYRVNSSVSSEVIISTAGISKGTYFLRVINEGKIYVSKIVIAN